MRRLVRGLWSLFWLIMLLAGVPAVLAGYVGWPLPEHWPTGQEWQRWVQQPLTRTTLVNTVAVIGWLLWALLVYAVAVELLNRARRAVSWLGRLRLPALPSPMQATASGMLGAAVFGMPTVAAHPPTHADAAQPVAPAPSAAEVTPPGPADPGPPATDAPATSEPVFVDEPENGSDEVGVALPDGGWLTDDTAAAAAAAAALVWLQRRRRYLPRPPEGANRHDADLAPLPDTVAAAQAGVRHGHTGDAGDADPAAARQAVPGPSSTVTVGEQAGAPLHLDDLPPGGVGLTGAGATAAARGLLVAMALSGRHRTHHARLITTATDLQTMLGPGAQRLTEISGLTVADALDDAIACLEQAALERHHHPAAQRTAGAADRPRPPVDLAPLMLVTDRPTDPATARRLAVILTLAAPLRITGVVLGAWPHGTTWRVEGDGTVHPADTPTAPGLRLSVLTPTATTDVLGLLREARPSRAHPGDAPTPPPVADNQDEPGAPPAAEQHPRPAPTRAAGLVGSTHPPAQARLWLRVLGAPSVHRPGDTDEPLHIRRSAAVQILVFLAVHRDGATTGQLAAALWPGLRPQLAANRLYTPISSLRTLLQQAAGADVLVRDGERYRLDAQHIDVDLWRLHAAVDDAATALDSAGRQRALHAVIAAYTGDLAVGQPWLWLAVPREAARRHVVDAYATLAALSPDPAAAVALLQDAIRVDPCNEELHRRAMRAYAAAGDSLAARQLLANFTRRLADLGLETAELFDQPAAARGH